MQLRLSTLSLFLLNILWGMLMGVVFYAHLVVYPVLLSNLPESAVMVTGPYGLRDGLFWMLIHPTLILTFIITLASNWRWKSRRKLIGISLGLYLLVFAATITYFVSELMAFNRSPGADVQPAEWLGRGQRWQRLSWVRQAIMHIPQVLLLVALRKPAGSADTAMRAVLKEASAGSYRFAVAGGEIVLLDDIANQLRQQISKLPPNTPQLAKQPLATQTGVLEVLVVVRGQETPHTHPKSDLIFSVLEGGGYVQLSGGKIEAPAGSTVVIPKDVCHAYHNTSSSDSVLLATFSPGIPDPGECVES
jgi:mannose-6-phosphate isomerase-like protein (cupin superfamily)